MIFSSEIGLATSIQLRWCCQDQDLKDELGPRGEITVDGCRGIHQMLTAKELMIYTMDG